MIVLPIRDAVSLARALRRLIRTPGLDERARLQPAWARGLARDLAQLSALGWPLGNRGGGAVDAGRAAPRLAAQRALYELNRTQLYWFDDPSFYVNERSLLLASLHAQLEVPWQSWLAEDVREKALTTSDAAARLRAWVARDLGAPPSPDERWTATRMDLKGYRRLLEIVSLNGLVEASQLSRTLGGAADNVQSTLFRILLEEYGGGRLDRKHSSYFARMLEEQGMCAQPEAYVERVPWEVLAVVNHAFSLSENKRHYLRFCGAFTHTEVSTPVSFRGYAAAARRLGLSDRGDYWSLHIKEDERHGAWMLEQVALPLLERFPAHRAEVLFGYAQQRAIERRAAAAIVRACRAATEEPSP